MRYHFIPLGLVFLLAGCGQDPVGPSVTTKPQVDAGPNTAKPIPIVDPGLCLKQQIQLDARIDQGGFELLPHPVCPKVR
jgi:hypothetical protein